MHKKFCISKSTGVVAVIVVVTFISLLLSSSLLKTKTSYQSKAALPQSNSNPNNGTIVGGYSTEEKEWPFIAAIGLYSDEANQIRCGASYIAPGWIITAGHCIENKEIPNTFLKPESIRIFLGPGTLDTDTSNSQFKVKSTLQVYRAKNIFPYIKYRNNPPGDERAYNDIVLIQIELDQKLLQSNLSTISLYAKPNVPIGGTLSIGLGRGLSEQISLNLRYGVMPLVDFSQANYFYPTDQQLDKTNITAGFPIKGVFARMSKGDSGGPLIVWNQTDKRWELIGVYNSAKDCQDNLPCVNVFTSIPYFKEWIIKTINDNDDSMSKYLGEGSFTGKSIFKINSSLANLYFTEICNEKNWIIPKLKDTFHMRLPAICDVYQGGR